MSKVIKYMFGALLGSFSSEVLVLFLHFIIASTVKLVRTMDLKVTSLLYILLKQCVSSLVSFLLL